MRTLCLIPARGGSKGIPRKNLQEVAGKPLIVWTIEQALRFKDQSEADVDVVVSTDDDEIAAVASAAGAEVPFIRPAALAEDTAQTEPVVLHAISEMSAMERVPQAIMLLQATSPLRREGTLSRAFRQYRESGVDSLVGVVPQSIFVWRSGDPPEPAYDVDRRPRRQDMPEVGRPYRETGSLYITSHEVYRSTGNRIGGHVGLFIMETDEGIDIDDDADLAYARQLLAKKSHP